MIPPDGQGIVELVKGERYEEALGISPGVTQAEISMTHLKQLYRFRDYPEVREALNKAESMLSGETDRDKGRRLSLIGKREESLPLLEAAVLQRGDALDYNWMGGTLSELGRNEEALPYLKKALELKDDEANRQWLKICRDHLKSTAAQAYAKGVELSQAGSNKEAVPFLKKAVELRGEWLDYLWAGSALSQSGQKEEAVPYLKKAVELKSDESSYLWLGLTLSQLGRNEEALPYLKKALELKDDEANRQWLKICRDHLKSAAEEAYGKAADTPALKREPSVIQVRERNGAAQRTETEMHQVPQGASVYFSFAEFWRTLGAFVLYPIGLFWITVPLGSALYGANRTIFWGVVVTYVTVALAAAIVRGDRKTKNEMLIHKRRQTTIATGSHDIWKPGTVASGSRMVIGNTLRAVYHEPSCEWVKRMSGGNAVTLAIEEARRRGYKPCRVCRPWVGDGTKP